MTRSHLIRQPGIKLKNYFFLVSTLQKHVGGHSILTIRKTAFFMHRYIDNKIRDLKQLTNLSLLIVAPSPKNSIYKTLYK